MGVPDFFIVGSPKTGTTSLYATLRQHPQVFMPELKEPRFLASDMRPAPGHEHEPREIGYPTTMEQYLALFHPAAPGQLVGEASAFYLWSSAAAQAIAELNPQARIVAMLREPASFLRSLHQMYQRWGVEEEKDLARATSLQLEAARRDGRELPRRSHRPQLLQYAEQVAYAEQLRRYQAVFPPEQILVLIYDDYLADNDATVSSLLRFLGLRESERVQALRVNVTTRTVRSQRLKRTLNQLTQGQGPLARSSRVAIKALTPAKLRRSTLRTVRRRAVMTEPEPTDEAYMNELRRRYRPEVQAVSELLGRDLVSLWGYDRLD